MKTISVKNFRHKIKNTPMFNRYTNLNKISLLANSYDEAHLYFILEKTEKMIDDLDRLKSVPQSNKYLKNIMFHYIALTDNSGMRSVIKSHYLNFIKNLFNNELKK